MMASSPYVWTNCTNRQHYQEKRCLYHLSKILVLSYMLLYGISSLTYIAVNILAPGSIYIMFCYWYTCSTVVLVQSVVIEFCVLFTHEAPIQRMRKSGINHVSVFMNITVFRVGVVICPVERPSTRERSIVCAVVY